MIFFGVGFHISQGCAPPAWVPLLGIPHWFLPQALEKQDAIDRDRISLMGVGQPKRAHGQIHRFRWTA
jgi:hypothetical protein